MNFREWMNQSIVFLDGGMGTMLQAKGLLPGQSPVLWNLSHPEYVTEVHKAYFDAGSHVVCTNTFGADRLKYEDTQLEALIRGAVACARRAAETSVGTQAKFVALDIGPTGRLLKPYGDFDFEDAVATFAQTIRLGVQCGVDLIVIETMNDGYETKAALLAAKENSTLPILVSNVYGADEKLLTGASPEAMVALLEGMGVDALGANCSLGPRQLRPVVERLVNAASVPVLVKPNGGLPQRRDGKTVYDITPQAFALEMVEMIRTGATIVGGCCGTTPEYIAAMVEAAANLPFHAPIPKTQTVVSSYAHHVTFGADPVLIGERINPTGKKRFKQALLEKDMAYILREGINQQEKGVHILDVNVGLPGIDETALLQAAVCELQAVIDLPLQIDTASPAAMEAALRRYNGKAMINSVNGKASSMAAVFPLVKKYGGVVVALTLDEDGIPADAAGRVKIAEKILATAATYGVPRKDILFDPLAMAVSADPLGPVATLTALASIRRELGVHTVLGVSNVSFGLPQRDIVNAGFFALALEKGLSSAIINSNSEAMWKTYHTYRLLHGMDANCAAYIEFAQGLTTETGQKDGTAAWDPSDLAGAIIKGFREQARTACQTLLTTRAPLDIVREAIIPALDAVGRGFEAKTVYLPQLLMSAEAAQDAFEGIKDALSATGQANPHKGKIILATVQGDIHDIGKNIVKVLLENYGFDVLDLGRDVPPETIVATVLRENAPLCGLSALMTTTVPAMAATITLLHEKAPQCKTVVGGAVLNADYAAAIGADRYAPDAMATVRYAEEVV